ncbi:ras-related protein Rab-26 isoform X2 [Drosophila novamexicana]|uniref:ras-related protein Rab-26 isoform X2 n=1 Tax=Drosophila novamexicana TaxID=47314 RepID=UPI0011E59C71|nr:ras-related protein Rab-26 isoform X2 [Drosophila novamexicana]
MRRQQTRYRSDSIAGPSTGATRKASLITAVSSASPTRRESLVKPTWQHITPGQLPPKTLDKINGIASDDSDDDGYPKRRPSVIVHQRQQSLSQQPLLPEYMSTSQLYRDHLQQQQQQQSKQTQAQAQAQAQQQSSGNGFGSRFLSSVRISAAVEQQPLLDTGGVGAGGGGGVAEGAASAAATTAAPGQDGAGATLCKSAGRALIRMISSTPGQDEDEDFDIMGKNKVVVVDGTRVKLQIWDTAGQERFRSVTHAYYRDAHALLLLYDVTNKTTFDNIRAWLGEIREYAQEDVVIVLIGNKADCSSSERQVKREDGERLGREHNVPFMETSAKTGLNVELAFTAVARQLKCRGYDHGDDGKFNVHDFVRDNTKARSVCAQCRNM